jgi:hypothetical protein
LWLHVIWWPAMELHGFKSNFPACIRRHQILSNSSNVITKFTHLLYLHASVLIKGIIKCALNESVCRTLSILFNNKLLKIEILKFSNFITTQKSAQNKFIIYAITTMSLITSNLLLTLLPHCTLSLPIYFLQIIWAKQSERFIYYIVKIQKPKTVKFQAFIDVTLLLKWLFILGVKLGGVWHTTLFRLCFRSLAD